jgi:hypothetical protein
MPSFLLCVTRILQLMSQARESLVAQLLQLPNQLKEIMSAMEEQLKTHTTTAKAATAAGVQSSANQFLLPGKFPFDEKPAETNGSGKRKNDNGVTDESATDRRSKKPPKRTLGEQSILHDEFENEVAEPFDEKELMFVDRDENALGELLGDGWKIILSNNDHQSSASTNRPDDSAKSKNYELARFYTQDLKTLEPSDSSGEESVTVSSKANPAIIDRLKVRINMLAEIFCSVV